MTEPRAVTLLQLLMLSQRVMTEKLTGLIVHSLDMACFQHKSEVGYVIVTLCMSALDLKKTHLVGLIVSCDLSAVVLLLQARTRRRRRRRRQVFLSSSLFTASRSTTEPETHTTEVSWQPSVT